MDSEETRNRKIQDTLLAQALSLVKTARIFDTNTHRSEHIYSVMTEIEEAQYYIKKDDENYDKD